MLCLGPLSRASDVYYIASDYMYHRGKKSIHQGAAKGVRQKEFDHFFRFRDAFGHFSVTFSDASVTFFATFFAKLLLPDSFCGRVNTPPLRDPSFLGLSPDPEVTEQKKLWCIPFSWENKGKGYTP